MALRGTAITMLDGVTASVSASNASVKNISRAKRVSFQFIRALHTTGASDFIIDVSNDGTNWYTYTGLIDNVTNTNSQYPTRVNAPSQLTSNTSKIYMMDMHDKFQYVRVYVTETADGTHTAIMFVQYE